MKPIISMISVLLCSALLISTPFAAASVPTDSEFNVKTESCKLLDYFRERLGPEIDRVYSAWVKGLELCTCEDDLNKLLKTTAYPVHMNNLQMSRQVFAQKDLLDEILKHVPYHGLTAVSKVSKTWKRAVFAEMSRRYGSDVIDWNLLLDNLSDCCRNKSNCSSALVEFTKSVWPKPQIGYPSAFYLKAFDCLESELSFGLGSIRGDFPLDLPLECSDLAVALKEREFILSSNLPPIESIPGHVSESLSISIKKHATLNDIRWLVEHGHMDTLKSIVSHSELEILNSEGEVLDSMLSVEISRQVLLACLEVSDGDRKALISHLRDLYSRTNELKQSAIMKGLIHTSLSLNEILVITKEPPKISDIIQIAPHLAFDYIQRPEFGNDFFAIEGLIAEDFSGPLKEDLIDEFGHFEPILVALYLDASDEAIISLSEGCKNAELDPWFTMELLLLFAMHLKRSEDVISVMLKFCNPCELGRYLTGSKEIPTEYLPVLCRERRHSARDSTLRLLTQVASKPRTVRIEAIESLIANIKQSERRDLGKKLSDLQIEQIHPMVMFGFIESLFQHSTDRACDLIEYEDVKNCLEIYFLGQNLQTLFSFSLLEIETDTPNATKFCHLAMRIAIKKFGFKAIVSAAANHHDSERLFQLIEII